MRPPDEYTVVEYGQNETALSPKEFKKMVNYATTLKSELKESDETIHVKLEVRGISRHDAEKIIQQAHENSNATRKLRSRQSILLGLLLMLVGIVSIFADMPGYIIGFFVGGIALVITGISFYFKK